LNVLVVTGIWPPDVGGPASHAPELADFLRARGHEIEVVTTASSAPAERPYAVHWVDRASPRGVRHARCVTLIRRQARAADIVYATSMLGRASLGAMLARRPVVVKLVADEAYERSKRLGLWGGDLEGFQRFEGGMRVKALRAARNRALGRVERLVCPSSYLASLAVEWGVPQERVSVLPNPAPPLPVLPPREEARAQLGIEGPTLAFAGRITRQKALEIGLAAVRQVPDARLVVAGDGPDLDAVREATNRLDLGDRVRFLGPQRREDVLKLFRAADASLLSSTWENFPHTVVESLAVGTPVVSTDAGGVPEVVTDGVNGLLVPAGDADVLAVAIDRMLHEPGLREHLAAEAAGSVAHLSTDVVYARLAELLAEAAR